VKRLGIPEDRLYATIFEGSPEDKVRVMMKLLPIGKIVLQNRKEG